MALAWRSRESSVSSASSKENEEELEIKALEKIRNLSWNVKSTKIWQTGNYEYVILFKDTCIPYPCDAYQYCEELYVVRYEGFVRLDIVEDFKMGDLLREIITWLVKSSGMKGSFFAMCKYLFRKVDSLSVIGSKKEQREFIDTFIRHLDPVIKRYKGTISLNTGVKFTYFTHLYNQIVDVHNDIISLLEDLLLSIEIFMSMEQSTPPATWADILKQLSPEALCYHDVKSGEDLKEFCAYFWNSAIHADHMIALQEKTLEQWLRNTPHTIHNTTIHCQSGQILLLYNKINVFEDKKLDHGDKKWLVIPKTGFHLESFNNDLNLPRIIHKIIMCFLREERKGNRFAYNEVSAKLYPLVIDDTWPELSAKSKGLLNENLLKIIVDLMIPEIFERKGRLHLGQLGQTIHLNSWMFHDCDRTTDLKLIMITLMEQYTLKDYSLSERFNRLPRSFKETGVPGTFRVPTFRHFQEFLKMYSAIFDAKPSPTFEEETTFRDVQEGIYDLQDIVEDLDNNVSFEALDDVTKRLENLVDKAKKLRVEKIENTNFEELAPTEEFIHSDDVIEI